MQSERRRAQWLRAHGSNVSRQTATNEMRQSGNGRIVGVFLGRLERQFGCFPIMQSHQYVSGGEAGGSDLGARPLSPRHRL